MKCDACHTENVPGRTYCGSCGAPIRPDRESVAVQTEISSIAKRRERFLSDLRALLAISAVLFAGAVLFRMAHRESSLPRFMEGPAVQLLSDLPASPAEFLPHPWIALPVPE